MLRLRTDEQDQELIFEVRVESSDSNFILKYKQGWKTQMKDNISLKNIYVLYFIVIR